MANINPPFLFSRKGAADPLFVRIHNAVKSIFNKLLRLVIFANEVNKKELPDGSFCR
jgi:hypothetical protein